MILRVIASSTPARRLDVNKKLIAFFQLHFLFARINFLHSLTSFSVGWFTLLVVMNGEKAVYASPTFSNRRQRTLDSLIKRLLQDHMHEVSWT